MDSVRSILAVKEPAGEEEVRSKDEGRRSNRWHEPRRAESHQATTRERPQLLNSRLRVIDISPSSPQNLAGLPILLLEYSGASSTHSHNSRLRAAHFGGVVLCPYGRICAGSSHRRSRCCACASVDWRWPLDAHRRRRRPIGWRPGVESLKRQRGPRHLGRLVLRLAACYVNQS
jgi:hypothetical protein